jgi:hypothetical protein
MGNRESSKSSISYSVTYYLYKNLHYGHRTLYINEGSYEELMYYISKYICST